MRETEVVAEVRWVEVFSHAVQLHATPLSSAELFRRQMSDHPRAWIFTSATLAVGEDFSHFTRELGVADAGVRRWASPFDFPRQALLYVPKAMPEPGEAGFTEAVIEAALPVLRASEGRAFLLFTTLRALRRAHELLEGRIPYPLLVQGTGSRSQLLARFRALGNAVLLGSQSFWEGVDVRGEALSLVVIDKLPFAPPDDPVLAARIEDIREPRRQSLQRAAAAAGGAAAQAGRGAPHPRRGRSRGAHAVRPAARHQALRPAHPREPAADGAYARAGGGGALFPSSSCRWMRMISSKLESARKPSASRAPRVEVLRPAGDDALNRRIRLAPDELHHLVARYPAQRLDLLADRRGDSRHAEIAPRAELLGIHLGGMKQEPDRGARRSKPVTHGLRRPAAPPPRPRAARG